MTNEEFQQWRRRMGFTMKQAAEALRIPYNTCTNYHYGRRDYERDEGKSNIPPYIELLCELLEKQKKADGPVDVRSDG